MKLIKEDSIKSGDIVQKSNEKGVYAVIDAQGGARKKRLVKIDPQTYAHAGYKNTKTANPEDLIVIDHSDYWEGVDEVEAARRLRGIDLEADSFYTALEDLSLEVGRTFTDSFENVMENWGSRLHLGPEVIEVFDEVKSRGWFKRLDPETEITDYDLFSPDDPEEMIVEHPEASGYFYLFESPEGGYASKVIPIPKVFARQIEKYKRGTRGTKGTKEIKITEETRIEQGDQIIILEPGDQIQIQEAEY